MSNAVASSLNTTATRVLIMCAPLLMCVVDDHGTLRALNGNDTQSSTGFNHQDAFQIHTPQSLAVSLVNDSRLARKAYCLLAGRFSRNGVVDPCNGAVLGLRTHTASVWRADL